jgi:hypothetical protein
MKLSLCLPCMNRTYDLKVSLPAMIKAGQMSPPLEISIVNYNSKDDLDEWIKTVEFPEGVSLTYGKYTGRDYYHMAHARNLSVVQSTGDYIIIGSADMVLHEDFIQIVRQMIEEGEYTWMQEVEFKGFIVVKREEFMAAGGYDERFEFYGPEDRDIGLRLFRRATGKFGRISAGHIDLIRTAKRDKRRNYRPGVTPDEMTWHGQNVAERNFIRYILVANEGQPW